MYNFGAASKGEMVVFGAQRPGYDGPRPVDDGAVEAWVAFMRQRGIERVCCLLDAPQLGYYPGDLLELYRQAFGALNICHAPVADFTLCPADLLGGVILPFLVESVRLEKKVVVHCSGGIGRTGHVLAAWLVHGRGFEAQAALEAVRFVDGALRNPGEAVEGDRVKQAALLALLEMSRKPAGL